MTDRTENPGSPVALTRLALIGAVVLALLSVLLTAYNDHVYRSLKAEEATTQAEILAASVAAAVAFDDRRVAQDHVDAVGRSPRVLAVAVYGQDGAALAAFTRDGGTLPAQAPEAAPPRFEDRRISVAAPVAAGELGLGTVWLSLETDPLIIRFGRYAAPALTLAMAALLVAALGRAQAALARANAELARRADALGETNRQLTAEIAQREAAEANLRQAQRMEAVGQMTGGLAHDFNNLLQALSGCLQLIARRAPDAGLEGLIEAGQQAVDRGAKLTHQLLAFARRQALRPEPVALADRVLGMAELLARALRADIRMELDLQPDLWPIEVDPTQFELAILNLVVNARDAMPGGGVLRIEARNVHGADGEAGDQVVIAVRDTGTGMPEAVRSRAFEPFFTTKGVGRGSGLGLSQVYGFVQQSNGGIAIDSAVGEGTAVILRFPRSAKVPAIASVTARRETSGQGARLLLAEDDPIVGAILTATLEDMGFTVVRAASGEEAADLLRGPTRFDGLLSDIVMPGGLSGIDLGRLARQLHPGLPIVLMTGYSETVVTDEFQVLAKPFGRDDVSRTLAGLADRRYRDPPSPGG